jgi:hypothetical protein
LDQYCINLQWIEKDGKMVSNCKIYDTKKDRQRVMPGVRCFSAEDQVKARLQPEHCPYSKRIPDYRCRVIGFKENDRDHRKDHYDLVAKKARKE